MKFMINLLILLLSLVMVTSLKAQDSKEKKDSVSNKINPLYKEIYQTINNQHNNNNLRSNQDSQFVYISRIRSNDKKNFPFVQNEEKLLQQKREQFRKRFQIILKELRDFIEKNKTEKF